MMMFWWCLFILVTNCLQKVCLQKVTIEQNQDLSHWKGSWRTFSIAPTSWSLQQHLPMVAEFDDYARKKKTGFKVKKKLRRLLLPLLLAYKLKYFTLIPILVGGLLLLKASTGLAGFFFALFAAAMGLKAGGWH